MSADKSTLVALPEVVSAALGARSFGKATAAITEDDRRTMSRYLRPDVDTWRAEFGAQLRQAGTKMLALIQDEMEKIPPAARAYTLAVLVDKATAMEARATMNGANVNIQINQFNSGGMSKDALLDAIAGRARPATDVSPPAVPTTAATPTQDTP